MRAALQSASQQLTAVSDVARLEAEILLAHVLQVSRTYLYTSPSCELTETEQRNFVEIIDRRLQGEPVAYLTGSREFWSLDMKVTQDVLIPRPETEHLVEWVLNTLDDQPRHVADLGTGSGAIALSLAKERPQWMIHATDRQSAALCLAKHNAKRLGLSNIQFHEGHWCQALPEQQFDAIVSNPPYVAECDWQPDLRFEPLSALVSGENGLADIRQIIQTASGYLKKGGYLFIEHGFQQAQDVRGLFEKAGYTNINLYQDLAGLDRVTMAQEKW